MRIKIVLLMLIVTAFYSCTEQNHKTLNDGFVINGEVKGISDSSWVFLQNIEKTNDSAIVLNNKFKLAGQVNEPTNCILIIKSTMDYKHLWVENHIMSFTAESGKFLDAKITGSVTQLDEDKYWKKIRPIRKPIDSLRAMLNEGIGQKDTILPELRKLEQKMKEVELHYVQENPNSYFSIQILDVYKTTWDKELTSSLFSKFSKKLKMSKNGKSIERYIQLNKNPQIGEYYIDFSLPNSNGEYIKLSDVKAKVILLDFWASWCGPCRSENINLVKIYKEFNPKGFEILGISGDKNEQRWLKAIEKDGLIWENLRGEEGNNSDPFLIYGINGIPDNFLINSDGEIIARYLRGEDLKNKLEEIL